MRVLLLSCFLLLIMACSQPGVQIRYYQLPYPEGIAAATAQSAPEQVLVLHGIQLAPFLKQRGIVYQNSATELTVARQHLWADDLASQLERQLRLQLAVSAPEWQLSPAPDKHGVQLQIRVDRLVGLPDGYALLSGDYRLSDGQRSQQHSFLIRRPLQDDGYPALVEAMAASWQQLNQQVAEQLKLWVKSD